MRVERDEHHPMLGAFTKRICFLLLNTKRSISGKLLLAVYLEKK